ncbi:MAG TPA: hypothetical protein VJP39_02050 [Gaiellaceae bacterium]|nr:hypothetical protein [Gaiellaceae bacterium]
MVDWIPFFEEKQARYARGQVMQGNVAYAAGLALWMAGEDGAPWLRRAAARWRESWEFATPVAWGRPIGILKALLLAGDDVDDTARWTLELRAPTAESPIGRYAGTLALLSLSRRDEALHVAQSLDGDFPADVAAALAAIARGDASAYFEAVASVVRSFETRDDYLEDVPVADTALVLDVLAKRNGIDVPLPASPVLP